MKQKTFTLCVCGITDKIDIVYHRYGVTFTLRSATGNKA
jgi:hypothetical protein